MPVQVKETYADIHTFSNLWNAYRKAAKGKRGRAAAAQPEVRLLEQIRFVGTHAEYDRIDATTI